MELTLDRSKYFATVHGDDPHGVMFMQDGLPFGNEGNLLRRACDANQLAAVKAVIAKREAEMKAAESKSAIEMARGDNEHVNLEAWLMNSQENTYKFHEIAGAIRKRFGTNIGNFKDAVRFLVHDEHLVTPEQLCDERKADLAAV